MRDAAGNVQSAVVLVGGSVIAAATLRQLAAGRCRRIVLAVREPDKVDALADELRGLGADVEVTTFDGSAPETHAESVAAMIAGGDVDLVLSAFGVRGNQDAFDDDPVAAAACVQTNFAGQGSALAAGAAERVGGWVEVQLSEAVGLENTMGWSLSRVSAGSTPLIRGLVVS